MGNQNEQWPWFAILVRTSREKSAALFLENEGYECFLPISKYMRRWSDRMKEVETPLFPGYLFCRMNPDNRVPVLMTPDVVHITGVGETLLPVDEQQISAIQHVGKSGVSMIPWPYLQTGQVVCLENGPLNGLSGIILRIKSGLKFVLSVSLLRRSVAVDVNRGWIGEAHRVRPLGRAAGVQPIRSSARPNPEGDIVCSS